MALYSAAMDLGLAMPMRPDAVTPEALAAVEAHRRIGAEKRLAAVISSLVTQHGHVRAYRGGIPAAARRLLAKAEAAGFDAELHEYSAGCVVQGIRRRDRVGFRAYWVRGKTAGGTWHSGGRDRWKLVDISDRPIGVDAKTHTTKVKCRHDEKDRTRLVLVESPRGVSYNVTEIEKRITS